VGYSKHIGRIGALAFALGVGIGLGAAPGVALAEDSGKSANSAAGDTTAPAPSSGSTDSPRDGGPGEADDQDQPDPADGSDDPVTVVDADFDPADPAGDFEDEDEADDADRDRSVNTGADVSAPPAGPVDELESELADFGTDSEAEAEAGSEDIAGPAASSADLTAAIESAPSEAPLAVEENAPAAMPSVDVPASTSAVTVSSVLASLLSPSGSPSAPESPAWWILAAAARRQLGVPASNTTGGFASDTFTSAALTPAQAEAIRRLGELPVGDSPTDVVATDTRAYVANSGSNSVTVIDTVNNVVLQTIPLLSSPTALAITPNGKRLYVTGSQAGRVWVIDTATNTVVRSIRVGAGPTGIAVSPSGSRVYVVNGERGTVSRISTLTNSVVGTVYGVADGTSSIAVSPDGSKIFTTSSSGALSYFSPLSSVAVQIPGVTAGSQGLAFGSDGSRLYVSDPAGSVKVIDTATREVIDSITVATGAPYDVAVSDDGTTLFVARGDDGKLSVYDLATKAELTSVVANPFLVDGPPRIALSPDGTQLYWTDLGNDRIHVISLVAPNSPPVAGIPVINAPGQSGVVTGSVTATDAEGNPLTFVVSTPGRGRVTVTADGGKFSFTYTPTAAARHAAAASGATPDVKADVFTITISDSHRGVVSVPIVVAIAPANAAPTATVKSQLSWFSANVYGSVTGRDADRDALTYAASPTAKGGVVKMDKDGDFTYTPTAAARHAAAAAGATDADKQDTFVVVVDDGHGGVKTLTVTVKVKPGNSVPRATVRTSASWFSADVYGTVTARDLDRDGLTYTTSATDKGGAVEMSSRGRFTYTPSNTARHAAAAADATDDDKQDTFDVIVSDGHGGTTTVAVTVRIKPANVAPTRASAVIEWTNPNSGILTGKITASDADGDALRYRTAQSTGKGNVTVNADGTFSYTPTEAARAAATKRFAPSWVKTDRFRVTIDDGHGGSTAVTVRVAIAPLGHVNQNPTNGTFTAGQPLPGSSKVGGAVTATDAERDKLVFSGTGATAKGSVIVDAAGRYIYTPSDSARVRAAAADATEMDKRDTFIVSVADGYGGTLAIPVTVTIVGAGGNTLPGTAV
jgi:YVTN family beta-propeller protein/VCBS repeat-containing protein